MQKINRRVQERIKKVFFVGIGGVGMSGIAEVLRNLGYQVAGSDVKQSPITERLEQIGIRVFIGHAAENIDDVGVVVVSSAISQTNPEIMRARELGIPVIRRAEMLAELMRLRFGIGVAGTHGKTTTTSLTAALLGDAGLDPSFVIGGILNSAGSNAKLGTGEFLVAEADESDTSFWLLNPMIAIVTNIDADHLENYQGSYEVLKDGFLRYLHNLPFYGLAVMCIEDEGVRAILPQVSRPIRTYGFREEADIRAINVRQVGLQMHYDIIVKNPDGDLQFAVKLNIPGKHNVLNSLAAVAVALELGVDPETIAVSFAKFGGVGRRFAHQGKIAHERGVADIFEDYGHHPSEIKAVLAAAQEGFAGRRIFCVFQPHRYTRTRDLLDDFAAVLSECEALVLTEVYSAGETEIAGANSKALARAIRARGQVEPVYIADKTDIPEYLVNNLLKDDDVVIFFGAGDIGKIAREFGKDERYQISDNG
ncbi:MAG: UDP-N-acetylmuramate--L-alanine ligase [Cardiobacteriaceae bacterium]|nr:UDP-N-acetylmuramate--L-alanine ligase [Cardiobacteriaceae bacterium]